MTSTPPIAPLPLTRNDILASLPPKFLTWKQRAHLPQREGDVQTAASLKEQTD